MNVFSILYKKMLHWAGHRHAPYYLAGISFAESSMLPVPPDIMLISMALAKPKQAWRYAAVATISSVLGGMFGYLIGAFLFKLVSPFIVSMGYAPVFQETVQLFQHWGVWIVFAAGFSPVPYKFFTIGAGAVHMAFFPFLLASFLGRGGRFFLVSAALYWSGDRIRPLIHKHIDVAGWVILILCLLGYVVYKISI